MGLIIWGLLMLVVGVSWCYIERDYREDSYGISLPEILYTIISILGLGLLIAGIFNCAQ